MQGNKHGSHNSDPLHGISLKVLLTGLVEQHGWPELSRRIPIKCFSNDPSISSSLKFLRKTPWAREKVEALYIASQRAAVKNVPVDISPDTPAGVQAEPNANVGAGVWQGWKKPEPDAPDNG